MKRFLPLILVVFGSFVVSQAKELTPDEALSRLIKSAGHELRAYSPGRHKNSLKFQSTVGNLYVFSSGKGYVVLPDDDAAPSLLAYSESESFELEGNPGLAYWMEYYNRELAYLKSEGITGRQFSAGRTADRHEIVPLIKTHWNQGSPYNDLCPKLNGQTSVTGCVATAMAQVLKYYNYPEHGIGSHSYTWKEGNQTLTYDYETTVFDWDAMTNSYDDSSSEASKKAVAELMLACGISVDMSYTPQESAASSEMMCESLIKIFNYSQGLWLALRDYFGYDDWEDMIYGELAENRPVLYGGRGTAGGHQFICDGYSSDGFFHINWGWGGMSDGYFLLTALSPSSLGIGGGAGGFNTGQDAAIGVCPPKAGDKPVYIVFNTQGFTTSAATVNAGDTFRIEGLFINFSLVALPAGSKFGMKFTPADESEPIYSDSYDVSNLEPYNGYKSLPVIFPELENGTYKITPALYTDGEWSEIRMPVGKPSALTAVVNDKEATLSNSVAASVEIKDIEIRPVIYRDREFPMTFTVVNDSDEEYYGNVTPVLVDADGNVVAKSAYSPIDVLPGKEDVITTYVADFVAEENQEFTVGDYKLVFTDDSGKYISSPVDVKVEDMTAETKITVTDFKLDSENPVPSPENTQFSYKVACDSGIYYNSLDLIVFPGAGGYSVYSKPSERTYLEAGESADVKMTADMSNLEDGDYMAMMYEGQTSKTDRVYFKIKKVATGIEVIEVETEEVAIYDLNGVRRELPLSPGIYILKTGGESRKLVVK